MTAGQKKREVCTHMIMHRAYGAGLTCNECGKAPSLGWLYACRQDESDHKSMSENSTEVLPVISDNDNYFESQAEVAKSIGMSKSVIHQMRTGQYSYEQIEILLAQRRHVLDVIRQTESVAKKCNYQVCHACRPAFQDRVEKFAIF